MTSLTNLIGILLVASHAGFQIAFRFNAVPAAVIRNAIDPAGDVVVRHNLFVAMAIDTKLPFRVADSTLPFLAFRCQRMGELEIQWMGTAIQILAFMTILAIIRFMAKGTIFITQNIDYTILRQIRMGMDKIRCVAHGFFTRLFWRMACYAGSSNCLGFMAVYTFRHSG